MKRFFEIYFVISILLIIGLVVYAGVQKRTRTTTDFRFDLKAGDRIIVIDEEAEKSYVRVTPPEARSFNYTVPDGKVMSGILTQRKK